MIRGLKLREKLNNSQQLVETTTVENLTKDIKWLFEQVSKTNHYRADNYLLDNYATSYTLCYTTTYLNGEPVLGSCAWNRPFYKGMIRICTRYCINLGFRHVNFGQGTDGFRLDVVDHIDQQVDFTKKLGFNYHFISREDKNKTGKTTKRLTKDINNYSKYFWKCSENRKLVCPDPDAPSCWQFIIYNNKEIE